MRRGDPADNQPAAEGGELSGAIARMGGSLRAWSLAVSFLGDCIVPRGGDVGMATITEVLSAFGIEPGVTRTAMSRLAGDGWVTRQKVGRMSFYALTPVALAESEAATRRIYAARHPQDPCSWRVVFGGGLPKAEQARLRAALRHRGAADLGGHVYVVPAGENPPEVGRAIALTAAPMPALGPSHCGGRQSQSTFSALSHCIFGSLDWALTVGGQSDSMHHASGREGDAPGSL